MFRNGKFFTCNSPYIQEKIKENYPSRHTIVVPNCINVKRGTQSLRHLCRQAPRIIAVNNGFFGRKNGEVLLLAFVKIAQRYPQVQLHLFGRGYEPDGEAAIWAAGQQVQGQIFYHGKVTSDQILLEMEKSDLLIHTSLEESFGLILIEAMLVGTPVIGGDRSGAVPWVLDYGRAGTLADVRDPMDVADKAAKLLGDEEAWKRISRHGQEYVKETFSARQVAGQYEQVYHMIMDGSF